MAQDRLRCISIAHPDEGFTGNLGDVTVGIIERCNQFEPIVSSIAAMFSFSGSQRALSPRIQFQKVGCRSCFCPHDPCSEQHGTTGHRDEDCIEGE